MREIAFVDTNVLVYARDAMEPVKQPRARAWVEALWRRGLGRVGIQVLNAYYVTVTQKLDPGLSRDEARRDVRSLLAWQPTDVDRGIMEAAFGLQDAEALSWWDALMVAAALHARSTMLLTEDLADGQRIGGLRVVDPFQHTPDEMLGQG